MQRVYWWPHVQHVAYCKAGATASPWDLPSKEVWGPEQQCGVKRGWMAVQVCVFSLQDFRIQTLMLASLSWWFSGNLDLLCVFIAIKFTLLWLSLSRTSLVINQDCTVVNFLIFISPFLKWVMKNDVFTSSPPHLLTCWTLELVPLTSSLHQGKSATDDKCGFGVWQAWGWLCDTSPFATINLSLSKSFLSCHCWCLFHIMCQVLPLLAGDCTCSAHF